jgi:Kdo2-lipid IVA lauroyltransferase/acyltransferase
MILSKPLRYRLEYLVFRAAQAAATWLPLELVSRTSGLAWRLIAPRLHRQQRALRNLALAYPELSEAERRRIARAMWENLGRTFGESFRLRTIVDEKRIRFEPMEQLEEIIRGGPCVVCGMHLGNWELVAYASKLMGVPFSGVYQRLSNPLVDEESRKLRAFLYDGGLLPKTPVTARSLMKAAKSGGYPAFLADLRDDNGAAVPFFGRPALATVFPALLARKTGLPLYAGAAYREPNVRFVIRAQRIEIPHTDDPAADALAGTVALQAQFEAFIRQAPEQWMWAHRKWV